VRAAGAQRDQEEYPDRGSARERMARGEGIHQSAQDNVHFGCRLLRRVDCENCAPGRVWMAGAIHWRVSGRFTWYRAGWHGRRVSCSAEEVPDRGRPRQQERQAAQSVLSAGACLRRDEVRFIHRRETLVTGSLAPWNTANLLAPVGDSAPSETHADQLCSLSASGRGDLSRFTATQTLNQRRAASMSGGVNPCPVSSKCKVTAAPACARRFFKCSV
jgi:hypothetical protein